MKNLLFEADEHREMGRLLGELLAHHETVVADGPVFPDVDRKAIRRILDEPLPEDGGSVAELFSEFRELVIPNSTAVSHPRFLPYVLPSSNGISPYAEAAASALNQSCSLWTLSPAANAIEQRVVTWFLGFFDFPETAGGIITSGGSMANLTALTAARDKFLGHDASDTGLQSVKKPLTIYVSEEVHNSVDKAVAILGLGLNQLRQIPCDDNFRIRVDLLEDAVRKDRDNGFAPFCVVGSAGTVTTGAIDPIDELAGFCTREGLWFHIDGAFGALAVLSDRYQLQLAALGRADSVSLDPHKFLFNPLEAGCLLVSNAKTLKHSFSFDSSYLTVVEDRDFLNYAEYGPQLSRSFKALKIWWSLKLYGRRAYAEAMDRLLDLAAIMGDQVSRENELELMTPVTLNCVCFRHKNLDDQANEELLRRLVESGFAFLGRAFVKGEFCMRACFINLRTEEEDIVAIINEVLRLGRLIKPAS